MNTAINKAAANVMACHSFKGHDFFESPVRHSPQFTCWAKRVTARAERRFNKVVAREEGRGV